MAAKRRRPTQRRRLRRQMYQATPIPPNYSANYLYWPLQVRPNEIIEVTLDNQANVYLLDVGNYNKYKNGQPFQYQVGAWATVNPFRITPPYQGLWYVIVDLGGSPGRLTASTTIIPGVKDSREYAEIPL